MSLAEAFRAYLSGSSLSRVSHFDRDDACRDSDNGIADNHDKRSEDLAEGSLRGNIAVADGSHCNNSPVHTERDAGKPILRTLNNIHYGTDNNDQGEHGEEEDSDLPAACD